MKPITHNLTLCYQPTTTTCGYASLSTLMSHYDMPVSVDTLLRDVPQGLNEQGDPIGSITAQLATWCAQQGFAVNFWSFDFLITDFGWSDLSQAEILERLKAVRDVRDVPQVGGKMWSQIYAQAYIDLIEAGGILHIEPHVTSRLLYDKLQNGPVYVNIAPATVSGEGRARYPVADERTGIPDDVHGRVGTHSVVVYGVNEAGDFLVADPWEGERVIDAEALTCAIAAANIECDSQCFQIEKTA